MAKDLAEAFQKCFMGFYVLSSELRFLAWPKPQRLTAINKIQILLAVNTGSVP